MQRLIITLDGPAGTGKSTVARRLASRLGLDFLDTGAMYRAVTLQCVELGVDPAMRRDAAAEVARRCRFDIEWRSDPPRIQVDGGDGSRDVTDRLRDADVESQVSQLASVPAVREVLVAVQRDIASQRGRLVTEGRDQGSVVFPTADVKFYLDASDRVRAGRRARQLQDAGQRADEDAVYEEIRQRDERDRSRTDGPLMKPDDAIVIDTTDLELDQVVEVLEQHVRRLVPEALKQ